MFGTPSDIFGDTPFGLSDWGRLAIYESVPLLHRNLDESENDLLLRRYFKGFEQELESIIEAIRSLPSQRYPLVSRGGAGSPLVAIQATIPGADTIIQTSSDHGFSTGEVVVFSGLDGTSPSVTGAQSIAQVISSTQFSLDFSTSVPFASPPDPTAFVRTYDADSVPVYVVAASLSVDPDYGRVVTFEVDSGTDLDLLGVGYVASASFTDPVSGDETSYTFEVVRMRTRNADDSPSTRNSIMCSADTAPDASLLPYNLLFVQPASLRYLTTDFGLIYDDNDPEFFRRSLVRNVSQYVVQKGSQKGFQIRSEVAGFNANAQSLYGLCSNPATSGLPASEIYESDGKYYTSIDPERFRLDDIPADQEFIDPQTLTPVYPLDNFLYADSSADKLSPIAAVAKCIVANRTGYSGTSPYVLSAVTAPDPVLESYDIPYGFIVEVKFGSLDDYNCFNLIEPGAFSLYGPTPAGTDRHFIEAEISFDVGTLVAEYLVGSPASFPVQYDPLSPSDSEYCILYSPGVQSDCCYCKSYKIRLTLSPTPELIDAYGGDGALVNSAIDRLIPKIEAEQLPIHAELLEVVLVRGISLDAGFEVVASPSVTLSASISVPMQAYYDEVAADDQDTDDVGVEVTIPSITVT
jgi:hypothetical protein